MRTSITAASLLAFLVSCAQEDLVVVRMAELANSEGTIQTTTDPEYKNLLIRSGKLRHMGMTTAFTLPPESVAGLARTSAGNFEVRSLDEGIVLSRPDTCDESPAVLREGARFRIWWSGGNQGGDQIFQAVSDSGLLWENASVALGPSAFGGEKTPRDAVHTTSPAIIVLHDTYHMYYTGTSNGTVDNEIFLATSPDGVNWTKYSADGTPEFPTPVLANTQPDGTYGMGHPSALVKDDRVYLYFTDRRRGAGGLWLAVSETGTRFQPPRRIAKEIENADVKYCPALGVFFMVYGEVNDGKLYVNVSPDGITWLPHGRERTIATGPPETVHLCPAIAADGLGHMQPETRVYYAGGIAGGTALQTDSWELESTWIQLRRKT